MKTLFLILTILLSTIASAQFFLGYSEQEVLISAQNTGGVQIRKSYDDRGQLHILWEMTSGRATNDVLFQNGTVSSFWIIPYDDESADIWITAMNRKFAKISSNKWRAYPQGIAVDIILSYLSDSKRYCFSHIIARE